MHPGNRSKLCTQVPLKMSPEHRLCEVMCPGGTWEARAPARSRDACAAQPFFTRPLVGHAHHQQRSSFPSPETHFPSKFTSTARLFSLCLPASTCLLTSLHSFYLLSLLLKTKLTKVSTAVLLSILYSNTGSRMLPQMLSE